MMMPQSAKDQSEETRGENKRKDENRPNMASETLSLKQYLIISPSQDFVIFCFKKGKNCNVHKKKKVKNVRSERVNCFKRWLHNLRFLFMLSVKILEISMLQGQKKIAVTLLVSFCCNIFMLR